MNLVDPKIETYAGDSECALSPTYTAQATNTNHAQWRSPLRYPGGKQKAVEQILAHFPASASEYREPLVGGGSIYLGAHSVGFVKHYWINDKFRELISFWQTVQDPILCSKLQEDLHKLHSSFSSTGEIKEYFIAAKKISTNINQADNTAGENNLYDNVANDPRYREALLFFFFNRVTFSGTTLAGGFSSAASTKRFTASSIKRLEQLPAALAGTRITNLDCRQVILEPGDDVFIFLDPPYYTATKLYGRNGMLHSFDHEKLAACLKQSPHRFLITYDECDEVRRLYHWAQIKPWSQRYGMNNCNLQHTSKLGAELFISNY